MSKSESMSENESEQQALVKQIGKAVLQAWCEECGVPIYSGTVYKTIMSEKGNTYVYCKGCPINVDTKDGQEQEG